jgi:MtN3 and saliva related transmembrane protein
MLMQELIGWGSALVLLPTFGVQTYRQWHDRHQPVSATSLWFFVLAFIGTLGQFVYSWMVNNWVYLALNGCLVVNNAIGLGIAVHRSRISAEQPARAS